MPVNFFKTFPLALSSLIVALQLCADDQQRIEQLKQQISSISVINEEGEIGGKNPAYPVRPQESKNAFFLTADFLYWRADLDGVLIAVKGNNQNFEFLNKMELLDVDFDWNPAFRVGLGGILAKDSWDLKAEYTRYTSNTHRSDQVSGDNALMPIWSSVTNVNDPNGPLIINQAASHASGHYGLKYNVADLELGRNYFVSRALSVRPFIGIRGVWIYQDISFHYSGLIFAEDQPFSPLTTRAETDYEAGGIRIGFDGGWHFNRQWSFFTGISGSLVYGEFDTSQNMKTKNDSLISHLKGDFNAARPNLEIIFGLQWETYFCKDRCRVSFGIGYEFVQWFLMNEFPKELTPGFLNGGVRRSSGDLGLQGGTFKGRFEF